MGTTLWQYWFGYFLFEIYPLDILAFDTLNDEFCIVIGDPTIDFVFVWTFGIYMGFWFGSGVKVE